jgi:putative FmdB family regulatory protein
MPLYEYECRKCGATFEVIQKFSDEPLKKHPSCGGRVDRLRSAPGLQFKGSGWYITDYARAGGGKESPKSEGGGSSSSSESSSTTPSSTTSSEGGSSSDKPAAKAKKKK